MENRYHQPLVYYVQNISRHFETIPVCLVDAETEIGDENFSLPNFTYIVHPIYPDYFHMKTPIGCQCEDNCSDASTCQCLRKNDLHPYTEKGCLVENLPLVYECGPACSCSGSCTLRVGQKGVCIPLQVFMTETRGWGVRTLAPIPVGTFVCEFSGEVITDEEAGEQACDDYLFSINVEDAGTDTTKYTIDAQTFGNVGRFLNHSCSPNLFSTKVLFDHFDVTKAHIMFYAAADIPALAELTYDYHCTIDSVVGSDGKVKKKLCHCGSSNCTGRIY